MAGVSLQEALQETLECRICLSLLVEPVSLPCGHSFCRLCLEQYGQAMVSSNKQCAVCRREVPLSLSHFSENLLLRDVARRVCPEEYSRRVEEALQQRASRSSLEPLAVFSGYSEVVFPGQVLSLYLYEPRYKLMMRRLGPEKKFAYVFQAFVDEDLTGKVAVIAHVTKNQFFPGGQCLIEAEILFPRKMIVDIYEEPGTFGLHIATLTDFRDKPIAPLIEEERSRDGTDDEALLSPSSPELLRQADQNYWIPSARISAAISLIQHCTHLLSDGSMGHSRRAYMPLPAIPDSLQISPAPSALTAHDIEIMESFSLFLMAHCTEHNLHWKKEKHICSQHTLQRLEECERLLVDSRQGFASTQLRNLGNLAWNQVKGVLSFTFKSNTNIAEENVNSDITPDIEVDTDRFGQSAVNIALHSDSDSE